MMMYGPYVVAATFDLVPASVFFQENSPIVFNNTCAESLHNFKLVPVINTIKQNELMLDANSLQLNVQLSSNQKAQIYFQITNLKNGNVYRTSTHYLWSKEVLHTYINTINEKLVKE